MRKLPLRLIAVAALCATPYLVMAIWLMMRKGAQFTAGYLIASLLVLGLIAAITRFQRGFFLAHFPVFVLATVFTAYALVQGDLPSYPIAYVLVTSSWDEVFSFFSIWQYQRALIAALAVLLLYLALSWGLPRGRRLRIGARWIRRTAIAAFALLGAVAATRPVIFFEGMAASPTAGLGVFLAGPLAEARETVRGAIARKLPYGAARRTGDELHVLIIGESARRDSWSVYGYARQTTPYLASLGDETIFFQHALSDGNATVYAVPLLLTGINPGSLSMGAIHGNLVDLAKEAGYHTSWLVNNDASVSYLLGMDADDAIYPHSPVASIPRTAPPDAAILPDLRSRIAQHHGLQFIGLHTFGSHTGYSHRYPPEFRHFSPAHLSKSFLSVPDQELLDTYDDSVLYTDWFLRQVIEAVRGLQVPVTITYVADHGEEISLLDGRSGHGFAFYSKGSFAIPAFVWVNAAYRRAYPDKVAAMVRNRDQMVRSHDFFYSIADLMGIRWPGYEARRSFASPDFMPDLTSPFIAGGNLVPSTDRHAP
jgi:glucan phosphoethanolaminetransferase (alkaline phosphatase superfamily)